ncbi:FAD-binding oxidoreductase [Albidovulum sp.]
MPHETALSEIETFLGDRLVRSKSDRALHGQNEAWFPEMLPDAVAYPETTAEVARIVGICARHGCPVTPWGAGSSLEGHALAAGGGISLDMGRMNRILAIRAEDMQAVVQPGVTRRALARELRATGLMFPVDPGADASLGGMAATRASGTTTVRYGTMRDNVMGLEVVLADGRVIRTGSGARKSAAGYDLTGLFVGSEGTLGIITELTLRLHGQPEAVTAATCAFDDFEAAVATVIATIQMGIRMARIEFVDETTAAIFNRVNGTALPEKPHLMVEFHGSARSAEEDAERFGEVVADHGGAGFAWAGTAEERNRLWRMRHDAYRACLASRPGCIGLVTDICVPISKLAEAVRETRADIAASGLPGPIVGHVGDGNFHAALLIERGNAAELATAKALAHRMAERALRLGGTITGEHGIGLGKKDLMALEHGAGWALMAQIKRALDPAGILNPGKVVETKA